jgi:hypothetical protein
MFTPMYETQSHSQFLMWLLLWGLTLELRGCSSHEFEQMQETFTKGKYFQDAQLLSNQSKP